MPMIVSPFAARLGRARGAGAVASLGMALIAIGALSLSLLVSPDAGVTELAPALVAIGTGVGLVLPNVLAVALAAVPQPDLGKASAVLNTARQVGAVVGVALGVAVFQAQGGTGAAAMTDGIRATLAVAAASAAIGAVTAVVARRREAALAATANA
jgi:MFS family permease